MAELDAVDTIKGRILRSELEVQEIVTEDETNRVIVTEWTLKGEVVKRDCHVIVKRGQGLGGHQAQM